MPLREFALKLSLGSTGAQYVQRSCGCWMLGPSYIGIDVIHRNQESQVLRLSEEDELMTGWPACGLRDGS